jgi:phosphoserine phosphatase
MIEIKSEALMKLAIYDFDGTYILKQTLPLLYKLWINKHLNDRLGKRLWRHILWRYFLYKLKIFGWNKRRFNPYAMRITADLFRSIPREQLDQFLMDNYQSLQNHVFEPIKEQLEKDRLEGFHTILLSGNLDIILKPFKSDGFDDLIGSISEKNHQILPSNEIEILIEDKKKEMILKKFPNADLSQSKAYADNGYDLPVLKMVGHPVAVNPDKELFQYATMHHFQIIKK